MKRIAVTLSVMVFFAIAIVGWACGLSPYACSVKAVVGAIMIYVVARLAGRFVVRIVADVMVGDLNVGRGLRKRTGEPRNK